MLRLRTIYRAENIGDVLKRVVNVCQREFVNGRPHTLASPGGGAMSALVSVLRQFAGLFVEDGWLALAILCVVALAGGVALLVPRLSLVTGVILLFGCLGVVV